MSAWFSLFFVFWTFIHLLEHIIGKPAQFWFLLNLSTTMLTNAFKLKPLLTKHLFDRSWSVRPRFGTLLQTTKFTLNRYHKRHNTSSINNMLMNSIGPPFNNGEKMSDLSWYTIRFTTILPIFQHRTTSCEPHRQPETLSHIPISLRCWYLRNESHWQSFFPSLE